MHRGTKTGMAELLWDASHSGKEHLLWLQGKAGDKAGE